jgi:hypothetical protein
MGQSDFFGLATPDLSLVLFVGLLGVVRKSDIFLLALVAALARKSFSVDPGVAILSGLLALAWLTLLLRNWIEVFNPYWRAFLAAAGAMGLAAWLALVHLAREGGALPQLDALLLLAFSSGLCALALGGWAIRLPGLTPLRRHGPW